MDTEKFLKGLPTTALGDSVERCPACGRMINSEFRFCNFCGAAREKKAEIYMNEDNFRLVKMALSYLENGDFINVDKVCKAVLIAEPHNALVYFIMLMSELQFRYEKQFEHNTKSFSSSLNYEAIMLYGDDDIKAKVMAYEKNAAYNVAMRMYGQAEDINGQKDSYSWAAKKYLETAEAFKRASGFKDADRYVMLCKQKADLAEKGGMYEIAEEHFRADTPVAYSTASYYYKKLGSFKDSEAKLRICLEKTGKIKR